MVDANLVKLAVDGYKGHMSGNYSVADSQETLRKALVEANNGSTKLDYKAIRDGKCEGLFAIIEELIEVISEEGLKGDEFFVNFIEDRNLALGDSNSFKVMKDCYFVVSEVAEGTQGLRRQRLEAGNSVTVNTKLRGIKIYEELNRVLAGRVDFNEFVDMVGRSFTRADLDDAYAAWMSMFETITAPYKVTGTYDEEALLDLVEHVEAATGETPIIVGTRKALRQVTTAVVSDSAKEDMYVMGHYGKFNGVEMVAMKQRHKVGTTEFLLDDNTIYVFAGEDKPIKRVTEGEVIMHMGDPFLNADLSQEYSMYKRTGVAVILDKEFGAYTFA